MTGTAGTFDHEDDLPRVPVPDLATSGDQLLAWCAPLVDTEQFAATREAVDAFLAGDGPILQAALEEYAARPGVHSWLDDFWATRYLGRRDRIALNANFVFLFGPGAEEPTRDAAPDRAERAARLITAALATKRRIDDENLPAALRRGEPLTMHQHRFLFSATRIPDEHQDTARTPYTDAWPGPSRERHVVVFVGGGMLRLDVLGPDGTPHSTTEIATALRGLDGSAGGASVGPLTTKARAAWAASRAALLAADPGNPEALDVVETALFCVALEPATPPDDAAMCARLLHGDSRLRWFDKAVSFIVFPDGSAGINVEHCRLDGTTVLSLVDGMLGEDTDAHEKTAGSHTQGPPAAAPITFVLSPELREDVDAAAVDFADYAAGIATRLVVFDDVGSDRAKELGTSPDAFVQMSYQLAHRRTKGRTGPTYESIATLRFHHGRTEAMRVVTPQVLAFVAAMDDPDATKDDRAAAFRAAADAHVARALACQQGSAPEQHLWELSLIQQRRGAELGVPEPPAVVSSPGWTIMRDDAMSTSSAPSVHVRGFGFGSTGDHCIGVAYVLLPDRLVLHLSTPAAVAEEMTRFADELRRAFDELGAVLG